jgi:hypothetical protein
VVLAATGNYPVEKYGAKVQAGLTRTQIELRRSLARLSEGGRLREANTSHVIQVSEPDAVLEAVVEVLAAADATRVPQAR